MAQFLCLVLQVEVDSLEILHLPFPFSSLAKPRDPFLCCPEMYAGLQACHEDSGPFQPVCKIFICHLSGKFGGLCIVKADLHDDRDNCQIYRHALSLRMILQQTHLCIGVHPLPHLITITSQKLTASIHTRLRFTTTCKPAYKSGHAIPNSLGGLFVARQARADFD